MQRRWFILHDAALHYYRSKKVREARTDVVRSCSRAARTLACPRAPVQDTTSAGNIPLLQCSSLIAGPLMIHVNVNSGRTFFLKCDTERERDLWFNAICVCIVTAVDDSAAALTAAAASSAAVDAPARVRTHAGGRRCVCVCERASARARDASSRVVVGSRTRCRRRATSTTSRRAPP